jgi:hypothetical protein
MNHTVEIVYANGQGSFYEKMSKSGAIKAAKKEAADKSNKGARIFIYGYNGQCRAYLNPDGNYNITGKSWL